MKVFGESWKTGSGILAEEEHVPAASLTDDFCLKSKTANPEEEVEEWFEEGNTAKPKLPIENIHFPNRKEGECAAGKFDIISRAFVGTYRPAAPPESILWEFPRRERLFHRIPFLRRESWEAMKIIPEF